MRYIFFLLLVCCLSSCSTCSSSKFSNLLDSAKSVVAESMREDSIRNARKEELRHQIDSIVASEFTENAYTLQYDIYLDKSVSGLDRNKNGLTPVVYKNTGDIVLISTVPGLHTPLHNRVEIEIAGTVYTVDSAYTYPLTQPDTQGFTTLPDAKGEVLYILQQDAIKLYEAIAAVPTAQITVRALHNDEVVSTYTLSEEDKHAITSAYRLHLLITELNELEALDVSYDD